VTRRATARDEDRGRDQPERGEMPAPGARPGDVDQANLGEQGSQSGQGDRNPQLGLIPGRYTTDSNLAR